MAQVAREGGAAAGWSGGRCLGRCDGVAEEIRNALAHVEGLKVIGRSSSFSFKGRPDDLRTIGQKLGVANVLEGSLRKEGNDIRVTAQLIRVADGSHLWSESYDRKLAGVLKVQDEIARAVVGALKVKLLPGATVPPVSRRRLDPAAHEQFLLGRDYLRRGWKEANFRLAVHAFESALAIDPGYAQAWAGLSRALLVLGDFAKSPAEFAESQRRMMAAAEKSIAIDPDLPDGYLARSGGRRGRAWEFAGAKADVERALQINPGDASANRELGEVLFSLGRARESVAVLQKASDLDPLDGVTWLSLGYAYLALGDMASARAAADRARKINPDDSWVWFLSGTISLLEGDPAAALAAAQRSSDETFLIMGEALARKELGQEAKAREALADLTTRFAATGAFQIAQVHAWWGERDAAFEWLERAYRQSDAGLIIVKLDPLLRSLRGDPRWKPFLRKLNLPVD
jgi:TolB-like protein/Flp pilus assembly protein TadD